MLEMNRIYNMDCMEGMKQIPDKYFELAIVDPPYRDKNQPTKEMRNKINGQMRQFGYKPNADFFIELFRVSQNQIVWGANNFLEHLRSTNCMVFWYKRNPMENYSDGEFAWTSFDGVSRCIPIDHFGAHVRDKLIIHPTQKPVHLYQWLLRNYAKPGDKILDTHMGSGSSIIACYDMGFEYMAFEIDKDYYDAACKRIEQHKAQVRMVFD